LIITGPAGLIVPKGSEYMPPTAQPLVGLSMKMEFRFAAVGTPFTVTEFHVPIPPVTV
jgi:hypothetical protein